MLDIALKPTTNIRETLLEPRVEDTTWFESTKQIISGNHDELTRYYNSFFPIMLAEAKRWSGRDESTCYDIVQESMLKAIRCMKPIRTYGQLVTWSKVVVRTTTYDWLRKQVRQLQASSDSQMEEISECVDDDHHIEMLARIQWIDQALQSLPADLCSMIDLRFRCGWSLEKIATKFGLKTGAIDGQIRRTLERLKQQARNDGSIEGDF